MLDQRFSTNFDSRMYQFALMLLLACVPGLLRIFRGKM